MSRPTAGDYTINYQGSTFTVTRAPLTVNAPSASAPYGAVPATFTPTYTGLVNRQAAPSTPATCTTTATDTSPPGTYPITCTGAADTNYTISYGPPGTLTITTIPTNLVAAPASFGLLTATVSATLTRGDDGAPIEGETIVFSVPGFPLGGSCTAVTNSSGVASCPVFPALLITLGPASYTASFAGDADYQPASAIGQLSSGLTIGGLGLVSRPASM